MIGEKNYGGELLGPFRLVAECGCGPAACVYQARPISLARPPVAIKWFHTVRLSPHQCRQFLLAVRLLRKLKHPHILPLLDAGFHEGFPYIVSEYAPNGSLADVLHHQPPLLGESLRILTQIGQALSFAHRRQIIHGNLKPTNILFSASGDALLADFGLVAIAEALRSDSLSSEKASQYMALEQAEGFIGQETDQYALGCIASELLTGQAAFMTADSSMTRMIHMLERSSYTRQFLFKALARQPSDHDAEVLALVAAFHASTAFQLAALFMSHADTSLLSLPALPPTRNEPKQDAEGLQQEGNTSSEPEERVLARQQRAPMHLALCASLETFQEEQPEEEAASSPAKHPHEEDARQKIGTRIYNAMNRGKASDEEQDSPSTTLTGTENRSSGRQRFRIRRPRVALICIALITCTLSILLSELVAFPLLKSSPMPPASPSRTLSSTPVLSPSPVPSVVAGANQAAVPAPTPTPSLPPTRSSGPILTPTSVVPPFLVASPRSLNAPSDCTRRKEWICGLTLTQAGSSQTSLNWSASSGGIAGVSFDPSSGTLGSGESTAITISVPKEHCPMQATFIFTGSNSYISVPWSC